MLSSLQIENIAIIEKASVEFSHGLNVLTGETGAGKSIIIDSINAVLGEKTSRELIRTGESSACVTALFENISPQVKKIASDNGLDCPDSALLLQRRIYKDGKNACRVNGMTVTLPMLRLLASNLVNIHGQRDSQALLDWENHMEYADFFAGNDREREDYAQAYEALCKIKSQINSLTADEQYKARKTDLLTYQINEITAADIKIGEKKELEHRKSVINNSLKLIKALSEAVGALVGDGETPGAYDMITSAAGKINGVASITKGLSQVAESLMGAKDTVEDAAGVLDDVLRQLNELDGDIDAVEERLDLIYRMSKKYGESEDEMLGFLEAAKEELDNITFSEEKLQKLNEELEKHEKITAQKAELLTKTRKTASEKLSRAIESELKFLDMPHVKFITDVRPCPLSIKGGDEVEFLISANPGEAPKSLGKVASGGELSRIMLAMKNVFSAKNGAETLIFDEIDSGVSGSAAGKIAVKLASLAKDAQVICITHQAQIAAFAHRHLFLSKEVAEGRTYTRVKELNRDERAAELARITFGEGFTQTQLSSSMQLMEEARKKTV